MKESVKAVLDNTDLSQNKTLNEIIFDSFKTTIIQGQIPVGERINEKEYADAMNISRTPIRYAVKMLEVEGLVEHIPNLGVVVKHLTAKDAIEIFTIRKVLDSLATVTAMEKMTEEDYKQLDELLSLTEAKDKEGDIQEVIQLFQAFHNFIYEKSEQRILKSVIVTINEYVKKFRTISLYTEIRRKEAIAEHRLIYHAMCSKDEQRIKTIIDEHLTKSLAFILKEIEN